MIKYKPPTLHNGDCLDVMRAMDANSVDLIATDPPYFKVKGEAWDRQWDTPKLFLAWLDTVLVEMERILKPNGSLYLFASPKMAARVEVLIGQRFNVLNNIIWRKHDGTYNEGGLWSRANKESLRRFFEQKECIIFAEHYGADNIAKGEAGYGAKCDELRGFVFEPLRAYLDGERERAGVSKEDINEALGFRRMGGMAGRHYFSKSQWCLPTNEHYHKMRAAMSRLNHGGEYLRREYEDLRREYEDLRSEYEYLTREYEDLRRHFSVTADVPYTDVWTFPTVQGYQGKHPCEKPVSLMRHIVTSSSREGATVFDPFMGSGTTGVAAMQTGRDFIGIELDKGYFSIAEKRISNAVAQPALVTALVEIGENN